MPPTVAKALFIREPRAPEPALESA
jgi:hypothetical protein